MKRKAVPSKVLLGLVAAGLILPMTISVVAGLAWLLSSLGDDLGGRVLRNVALGCGILWVVVLVVLLLTQAVNALGRSDDVEP